jgi:hypothetical protein
MTSAGKMHPIQTLDIGQPSTPGNSYWVEKQGNAPENLPAKLLIA